MKEKAGVIKKLSSDDYAAACFFCKGETSLHMFPHRKDGKVVGFIFSCCDVPDGVQLFTGDPT